MPEEPVQPSVDVSNIRFGIKTVVAIIAVVISLLGGTYASYYGITNRITTVNTSIQQLVDQNSEQNKKIEALTTENQQLRQQVIELTVTLRTKGVIK
jgi:cell division protein FtsB